MPVLLCLLLRSRSSQLPDVEHLKRSSSLYTFDEVNSPTLTSYSSHCDGCKAGSGGVIDDTHLQIPHELVAQIGLSTGGQAHHRDYDLGLGVVRFGDSRIG